MNYFTNGLNIRSELFLPELPLSSQEGRISIKYGQVPGCLEDPSFSTHHWQITTNACLLDVKNTARYLLKNNDEIIIEPYPGADENEIRIFLLSSIFCVLFHKNGLLPMHASCIKSGSEAILISGVSGAGKSTIALAMQQKGFEILNDDISTVTINSIGIPEVHPGYIHLKLWDDTLEHFGYMPDDYRQLRKEIKKFSFPVIRRHDSAPVPVRGVFILEPVPESVTTVRKLTGFEAFKYLKNNTFGYHLVKEIQAQAAHFKLCAELAAKAPVMVVSRPATGDPAIFSNFMVDQINLLCSFSGNK